MAPIILYHSTFSPFSRAVLLYARYLNINIESKVLDLMEKKEQLSEEFMNINPQHCLPTIDDNGFILWESRAILTYLLESRAPHLVPTSPKEKAIVNQRLHFELGGLTSKFTALLVSYSNRYKFNFIFNCAFDDDHLLICFFRIQFLKASQANLMRINLRSFMTFFLPSTSIIFLMVMNGLPAKLLRRLTLLMLLFSRHLWLVYCLSGIFVLGTLNEIYVFFRKLVCH